VLILGGDFETSGLSPEKNAITEVGMVLWDTDLRSPIRVIGYLVDPWAGCEWDPITVAINGITPELCSKFGYPDERALKQFLLWYQMSDYACFHNGTRFDRPFFNAWCARYGYDPDLKKVWIDTNTDIELGELEHKMSRKLTYMAADHQFLNPFPHRAVFDVMTMLKVLEDYDLDRVIYLAKQPSIAIQAMVSYDDRELAKARGYRWCEDPRNPNGKKIWMQTIKECFLEKEIAEAGFPVTLVKT
jgi:DNA polymerase-3 subunit epsilon